MKALFATLLLATGATFLCLSKSPDVVLDHRQADYIEDEAGGRVLASLDLQMRRSRSGVRLRMTAGAVGPNVDPIPGYRGIRGGNHITARELESTLKAGQLEIVTQHAGRSGKHFGRCWPGRWGHIVERRVDEDGRLHLDVQSQRKYLLEVHGESVVLPDGEHDSYLEVKGIPRLRVRTRVDGASAQILEVQSLGGHDVRQ